MITWILVSHIRALVAERMKINNVVYTSVIYNNVIRTVCLTIVNLISAIFIILVSLKNKKKKNFFFFFFLILLALHV
jgi:hypothetical protein